MANRRAKSPTPRAGAVASPEAAERDQAPRGAAAKRPAPAAEAKAGGPSRPKWVSALATPAAAAARRTARRPGGDALDAWVNTPAADPQTQAAAPAPAPARPAFGAAARRTAAGKAAPAPAAAPEAAKTEFPAKRDGAPAAKPAPTGAAPANDGEVKPLRPARSPIASPQAARPAAPTAEAAPAPTKPAPAPRAAVRPRVAKAATASAAPAAPAAETREPAAAQVARPATPKPEAASPAAAPAAAPPAAQDLGPAAPKPESATPAPAAPPAAAKPRAEPGSAQPAAAAPAPAAAAPAAAPPPPRQAAPTAARASQGEPFGMGPYPMPNIEALARNMASAYEHAMKAFAAYMRPRESGEIKTTAAEEIGEMIRSLGHVAEYYMADPKRAFEAQTALMTSYINLWAATLQRFQGQSAKPVAEPDRSDKRFADAQWKENPFFDFLKQAYVLTSDWADDLVRRADDMDPHARHKAQFYLKQVTAALAPSNFIGTNPELLRATLAESGENLVRGLKMLAEDIEAGKGNLRIRQVDARAFKLGVNMAATPGKVIFRNELIELIQYAPTTPEVHKRPLLIVPPWINKFYILDLNPEKSFIRWAVSQGLTVFVISWVNPDARHADKDFTSYMNEGILAALGAIEQATGERRVTTIGYCVGGTLLAATLGYMAAEGDDRIESATFFTTQIDFTDAGDLKVFVDAEQLKQTEEKMAEQGYLEGAAMAQAFNMLRPSDLIWSYYVNNYLKGKEPMAFDLLVWNADSTRMPAANHRFYLRHCYFQNDLSQGRMEIGGRRVDLKKVTIPVYELAAREDHIAPARSAFNGAKALGGPVRYVMAGSGHIAGVVNPPTKPKYQYWTNGPVEGPFEDWVKAAKETPGSWWPDWIEWVTAQAPEKVPARTPGDGKLKPLCDAPGTYVRAKS